MTDVQRLSRMAQDADALLIEADTAAKGHAAIRNAALWRLCHEYHLTIPEVAQLTRLKASKIQNSLQREAMRRANATTKGNAS